MRSFAESDSHSLRHNLHFPNMSSDVFLYHVLHFHYRTSGWEFIFFLLHTCIALWTGCFCLSSVRRLLAIPFKSFFLLKSFPLEVPSIHFSGNSYCFVLFFSNWILPSNFVENTQHIRLNFCFFYRHSCENDFVYMESLEPLWWWWWWISAFWRFLFKASGFWILLIGQICFYCHGFRYVFSLFLPLFLLNFDDVPIYLLELQFGWR